MFILKKTIGLLYYNILNENGASLPVVFLAGVIYRGIHHGHL